MRHVVLAAFAALLFSTTALAGNDIRWSLSGNKITVTGVDLRNVGSISIDMTYDVSSMKNVTVEMSRLNGQYLSAGNAQQNGLIKIGGATTTPINGTVTIATISFTPIGKGKGAITSLVPSLTDPEGKYIPVGTNNSPSSGGDSGLQTPDGNTTAPSGTSSGQTAAGTSGGSVSSGSVTPPGNPYLAEGDAQRKNAQTAQPQPEPQAEVQDDDDADVPQNSTMPLKPPAEYMTREKGKEAKPAYVRYENALDRFRAYTGKPDIKEWLKLLQKQVAAYRQEPPAVIADGKSRVKLYLAYLEGETTAPNFAATGAQLLSLKGDADGWVVEVLPKEKTADTTITAAGAGSTRDFVVATAPSVNIAFAGGKKVGEADFRGYLAEREKGAKGKADLNRDGKVDYHDDYIFTVNYFVKAPPAKPKTPSR